MKTDNMNFIIKIVLIFIFVGIGIILNIVSGPTQNKKTTWDATGGPIIDDSNVIVVTEKEFDEDDIINLNPAEIEISDFFTEETSIRMNPSYIEMILDGKTLIQISPDGAFTYNGDTIKTTGEVYNVFLKFLNGACGKSSL